MKNISWKNYKEMYVNFVYFFWIYGLLQLLSTVAYTFSSYEVTSRKERSGPKWGISVKTVRSIHSVMYSTSGSISWNFQKLVAEPPLLGQRYVPSRRYTDRPPLYKSHLPGHYNLCKAGQLTGRLVGLVFYGLRPLWLRVIPPTPSLPTPPPLQLPLAHTGRAIHWCFLDD